MRFSETRLDELQTRDGQKLDIHIWEPEAPKAVLLAIHGGLAHAGDYVTPALFFRDRGIATASYDLRGHKQQKVYIGDFRQYLEDTVDFLQWVKNAYTDTPILVMGHSMGGLIATYFGLAYARKDPAIRGYILSSPYYENAIKIPPIMIPIIKILGSIAPKLPIPGPDLTDLLTHDDAITERHRRDEADDIRASKATMRFGSQLLKAQKWVKENFGDWRHPTFAVIAGADQVADPEAAEQLLKTMDADLLTYLYHPENFHENFNEVNRKETFEKIHEWIKETIDIK